MSIFRKARKWRRLWTWGCIGACVGLLCVLSETPAKEPSKVLSQYIRQVRSEESGFPGGTVYAITQTNDGFLWIGTEKGLVRFDGLDFELFRHTSSSAIPPGPVLGLTTDGEGNLWVRLQGAALLRYRNGAFEDAASKLLDSEVVISSMVRGTNGQLVLSSLRNGIVGYRAGRFERLAPRSQLPNFIVISMAEMEDGTIWLGTRDTGLFELVHGQISEKPRMLRDRKINCLLADKDQLWIGTDNGLERWKGGQLVSSGVPEELRRTEILAMTRDREKNIWIGNANGLFRMDPSGGVSRDSADDRRTGPVTAVYEDREGNLWTGSHQGLVQLREGAFTTYSTAEGMPSESAGPVYADSNGRLWFGGAEGGLYWIANGKVTEANVPGVQKDIIYSIAGGNDGIWLGRQRGGLTHVTYEDTVTGAKTYTESNGLAQNSVYTVYEDREGRVWAGTLSGGISEYWNGRFTTYTTADGLASNTITSILQTTDGAMWFGTPKGVSSLARRRWSNYGGKEGLPNEEVICLLEDSEGVLWVGTAGGLAEIRSGRVWVPNEVEEPLHEPVLGIAEGRKGWIWVATSNHVVRVNRDRLLGAADSENEEREYGMADGLRGTEGVRRSRSVVGEGKDRIWFSMNHGISYVEPSQMSRASAPAIVQIEDISEDDIPLGVQEGLRIPAPHHRVKVSYAGLSLSIPDRVRYRYMLDGFDQKWSAPTTTREAMYTNLASGPYRFRVMASNSEGVWNGAESSVQLEIEPLLWERWWFRLSTVAAIGLAVLLFFHLRMLRLSRQMNMRFEERLGERTRIAQELHDTLLQGVISASMQLHVAADKIPAESPARAGLERILALMGRVIEEGRNAVGGLRSHMSKSINLGEAFSEIQHEFTDRDEVEYHVVMEGPTRPLHPVICDEIYRIGREALTNAFRHAHASRIEVELEYAPREFRVLVRDNGVGFDPKLLQVGREGHWGLSGMRERAKRIEARLRVLSRPAAGTEVELTVPSHVAYGKEPSGWLSKWLSRFVPREKPSDPTVAKRA